MTRYYIDPEKYSLDKFQSSLDSRELIPSRQMLKKNLKKYFDILRLSGIRNLADLLSVLSSKSKIGNFAENTGLTIDYLTLLRREAKSYFSSPVNLSKFADVDKDVILKLAERGIKTSKHLFELVEDREQKSDILDGSGLGESELSELISLSDLSRLYGVGPAFAGMLYEAGIDSVKTIIKYKGDQIRDMYEEKTKRTADFTARDIDFTLEIAKELEPVS